jgi:hypothetical protein
MEQHRKAVLDILYGDIQPATAPPASVPKP